MKTQVLENASTENASTMQTFSQIKTFGTPGSAPSPTLGNEYGKTLPLFYFTSQCGAFSSGVGKWITDCFFF